MFKIVLFLAAISLQSQSLFAQDISGKLLLTAGVSQIEGAAGGGLTPWAFITGYGTRDQIGASTYYTKVDSQDYSLESYGVGVGFYDRVELSFAKHSFNTLAVGQDLGLGHSYRLKQDIFGVKVKLYGDAVLDQASWMPQVAIGAQFKENKNEAVVKSLGVKDNKGIDYYVSATKILLNQSLLYNLTLRTTKANQLGILGFGGDKNDSYELMYEGSVAYLLTRKVAIGLEYRAKPDNLSAIEEENWFDIFAAWTPTKNMSLTVAYVDLGQVATKENQSGFYSSLQIGF